MKRTLAHVLAIGSVLALTACATATPPPAGNDDGALKTDFGVSDTEISVGILSDYSGPIAESATSGSLGMELYFDSINEAGGVCGRDIVAVKGDTKYDPQQTTQAYRAISDDILMIGQLLGATSVNAVKSNIARDGMPTVTISLNTDTLALENIYVPLPLFEVELVNGVVWAGEKLGASKSNPVKVAIVTASDDYGKGYAAAVRAGVEATPGMEVVSEVSYTATDQDFTAQVSELSTAGADVVMLGTGPGQTAGFVGTAAQLGYSPMWVSSSGAWFASLAKPLTGLLDNFYVSSGYGTMVDDVPGITALKKASAEFAPDAAPSNFQVGGWLTGIATVTALEKACDSGDMTRAGVIEAFKDLKVDYDGITPPVNMGNGDQVVSDFSRMNTVGPDGNLIAEGDFYETDAVKEWSAGIGN